jgi:integrase
MPEELYQTLAELKVQRDWHRPDCEHVFVRDGQPIQTFNKAWKSACKRVGLEGLLFHDLRRSAIRNLLRAGVPQATAMKISGHRTASVFRRYAIVSEDDLARAAKALDAYNEKVGIVSEIVGEAERIVGNIQDG